MAESLEIGHDVVPARRNDDLESRLRQEIRQLDSQIRELRDLLELPSPSRISAGVSDAQPTSQPPKYFIFLSSSLFTVVNQYSYLGNLSIS